MSATPEIIFRTCTASDFDFVKQVHFASLREAITHSSGWDDEEQNRFVSRWFKPERVQIIQRITQCNAEDAGFLIVERQKDRIFLESLSLLPKFQNQGIGKLILKGLITEAEKSKAPITLLVLKANRARKLYDSLGFIQTFEDRTHSHLKWEGPRDPEQSGALSASCPSEH
ncbi:MAG: GNAT family N-acetyltransferase [Methylotenera sp.]|nr:GNAT family N-acetyltransferase [Oligoflexia bacterium]